jgi:hypothetical protein
LLKRNMPLAQKRENCGRVSRTVSAIDMSWHSRGVV